MASALTLVIVMWSALLIMIGYFLYEEFFHHKNSSRKKVPQYLKGAIVVDYENNIVGEVVETFYRGKGVDIAIFNGIRTYLLPYTESQLHLINLDQVLLGKRAHFIRGDINKLAESGELLKNYDSMKKQHAYDKGKENEVRIRELQNIKEVLKRTGYSDLKKEV